MACKVEVMIGGDDWLARAVIAAAQDCHLPFEVSGGKIEVLVQSAQEAYVFGLYTHKHLTAVPKVKRKKRAYRRITT